MTELRLRDMDGDVLASLKHQARLKGISLHDDVKAILAERAMLPWHAAAERFRKLSDAIKEQSGELPDSSADIREERERRF